MQLSLQGVSGRQTLTDKHLNRILLYINTIRYLKPSQVFGRIWFNLRKPKPKPAYFGIRHFENNILPPFSKKQSMLAPDTFRFLNKENKIRSEYDWNNPEYEKLWLYNLHYFDDLRAEDFGKRLSWHKDLIDKWIDENPPFSGNGWEPYPLSRRIVNWILWQLSGNSLSEKAEKSLFLQVLYLKEKLEWHILGNHILANAQALIFAGLFFSGKDADKLFEKGMKILKEQLIEQIFPDGFHFERTPMYQSIILNDLLETAIMLVKFGYTVPSEISDCIKKMAYALSFLTRKDDSLHLYNDSANGIAPPFSSIKKIAEDILSYHEDKSSSRIWSLPDAGYCGWRDDSTGERFIISCGNPGPSHQPGHAHCDIFSFELDLNGHQLIVDSGVSSYENDSLREYVRSTRAHNTVTIGGKDQSEIWGVFRMARRADIKEVWQNEEKNTYRFNGSYTPFHDKKTLHHRMVSRNENSWIITDKVQGSPGKELKSYIHFHPDCIIDSDNYSINVKAGENKFKIIPFGIDEIDFYHGSEEPLQGWYCPEFGIADKTITVEMIIKSNSCKEFGYKIMKGNL